MDDSQTPAETKNTEEQPIQKSNFEHRVGNYFLLFSIVIGIFVLFSISGNASNFSSSAITGNAVASSDYQGDAQVARMYVQGSQYILNPSTFKIGVPVRIEAEMSKMPGCSKSIVISAFNIRKSLTTTDNIIEFTPTKAGTFNIACSMNMYRGTFTVLQADGTKSNNVEEAPSSSGGCGGGGGGCGGTGGGCGCGGGGGGCGG